MKILVTGGAGFIGSSLIWELNRRGLEDIVIADFLGCDQKWKNLVHLRYDDYLEGDKLLETLDSQRLQDVTTIYHLGACSSTTESDCAYLIENNFEYTRRLAEWAIEGNRRFVYASSAATYGDGSDGMKDVQDNLNTYHPLNMYGYSKHLFDLHAHRRGWLNRIVGLKYFNVYGPNELHKGDMRSVVNKAYHQIKKTGGVNLFKSEDPEFRDGEQMRDFLYVKDAVDATIHLAENPNAAGLYNLGSGKASTWIQLIRPIFGQLKMAEKINFIDLPDSLRGKYQYYTCANIDRIRSTGWGGPKYSLVEAVEDYVSRYLIPGHLLGQKKS